MPSWRNNTQRGGKEKLSCTTLTDWFTRGCWTTTAETKTQTDRILCLALFYDENSWTVSVTDTELFAAMAASAFSLGSFFNPCRLTSTLLRLGMGCSSNRPIVQSLNRLIVQSSNRSIVQSFNRSIVQSQKHGLLDSYGWHLRTQVTITASLRADKFLSAQTFVVFMSERFFCHFLHIMLYE